MHVCACACVCAHAHLGKIRQLIKIGLIPEFSSTCKFINLLWVVGVQSPGHSYLDT